MLMKWSDLEIGDIVRISKEVSIYYKYKNSFWHDKFCYRDLNIAGILITEKTIYIRILLENNNWAEFSIAEDGKVDWECGNKILFDIVSLKED